MSITKPVPGTLQEGGASFETTHWTVVLRARQSESAESAHQALSTFCEAYWPPLYAFLLTTQTSCVGRRGIDVGNRSACAWGLVIPTHAVLHPDGTIDRGTALRKLKQ